MPQLRDVMTRRVLTVTPEASLRDAADVFALHRVSGAPVVIGTRVVGVVTVLDLLDVVIGGRDRPDAAPDAAGRSALDTHTVAEVMTGEIVSLPPTADVRTAAELMRRARVHRVLVIGDGELLGIVSATDIARAVADHRLTSRTYLYNRAPGAGEDAAEGG